MKLNRRQKITSTIAAGALVFGASGVAWAYFSSSGTGTGAVTTGHAASVTVTQDAFGGGNPAVSLLPAGPSQPIGFSINNPGAGDVHVAQVAVAVAHDVDGNALDQTGTAIVGCLASWYTIAGSPVTNSSAGWEVAAGTSVDVLYSASSVTVSLSDPESSQNACIDKQVRLIYTAS